MTAKERAALKIIQENLIQKFRDTPPQGTVVTYLKKRFIVFPNVFYPHEDSKPLIENYLIHKGDKVLDVGTGSGIIAIFSALKGASRVLAIDINPDALRTAVTNVKRHKLTNIVEVRHSNGFSSVRSDEIFNVITANLPFTEKPAIDMAENSIFDPSFGTYKNLFENINKHLGKGGRLYLSQANFGSIEKMINTAENAGFKLKLIGERKLKNDFRIFYAFELKRRIL